MILELCIPPNCFKFIAKISGRLAVTEQHLTLEFLNECFIGFDKSTEDQRYLCLHYMTPWIPNLAETSHGTAEEVVKTKEVLRMLISISLKSVSARASGTVMMLISFSLFIFFYSDPYIDSDKTMADIGYDQYSLGFGDRGVG